MAKASRIAASQAQSLADIRLLVFALCEKAGIDVDKVLDTTEPQTRDEMKAYANAPAKAAETPAASSVGVTKLPAPSAKGKQSKSE